jgi:hypothetical protein
MALQNDTLQNDTLQNDTLQNDTLQNCTNYSSPTLECLNQGIPTEGEGSVQLTSLL